MKGTDAMNRVLVPSLLILAIFTPRAAAQDGEEEKRKAHWQDYLEHTEYRFEERRACVFTSLLEYHDGDCQFHIIRDPVKWFQLTFKFTRGDREILTLLGHKGSIFQVESNVFYFALFCSS